MENQKIQNNEEDNYNFQGKNQTEMTNLKQIPISKKEFSIEDVDDSDDILIEKKDKVEPAKKAASFFQLQYQMSTSCDNIIMIIALLGSLGMGISMPLFSVVFGGSINTFGTVNASGNETFISDISSLCAKFVYVGLGIWASGYIMIWLWGYNGRVIAKRIKERYFELLLSQEQGWYDQQNVNEFSTKIQTQVKTVEIGVSIIKFTIFEIFYKVKFNFLRKNIVNFFWLIFKQNLIFR